MTQPSLFGEPRPPPRRWPQVWDVGYCSKCKRGYHVAHEDGRCALCWADANGWEPEPGVSGSFTGEGFKPKGT